MIIFMLYRLLCLLGAGCWLACTAPAEPETSSVARATTNSPGVQRLPVDREPLRHIPINASLFCPPGSSRNCLQEAFNLKTELMEMNPIPVPQSDLDPPLSLTEADQLYRQFVTNHAGEPLLAVFQQVFPRVLLNRYRSQLSRNYPLLTYYTQQLVDAKSYDIVTQAAALNTLKPHVRAAQFNQLVRGAVANARQFRPVQRQLFAQHMASPLDTTGIPGLRLTEVMQQIRAQAIADNQAIDRATRLLEQLQAYPLD